MNLNNLKIVHIGLHTNITKANAVVVVKKPGELTLENLSNYLSLYESDEIRRAELVSTDANGVNKYELEDGNPKEFNLMIFVCNQFSNSDVDISPRYQAIGYMNLPTLGLTELDPKIEIKLNFNLLSINDVTTITADLTNEPEYLLDDYFTDEPLSESKMIPKTDLNKYGIELVPSNVIKPNSLTYIPDAILSNGSIYKIPRINVDISDIPDTLLNTTYISYKQQEYIMYEFNSVKYLKNETLYSGIRRLTDLTNTDTIKLEFESRYETLLMPDWVAWKINTWKYISTDYYRSQGFTKISEIIADNNIDEIVNVHSDLEIGLDRVSNDVNMIFSSPGKENWFLQTKLKDIVQSNRTLKTKSVRYSVKEHNLRFYIIKESIGGKVQYSIVDYIGNKRNNFTYYKLLIDGACIIKINGKLLYFEKDLVRAIDLDTKEDLYKIYPGATALIIKSSNLDLSNIIILRDRLQFLPVNFIRSYTFNITSQEDTQLNIDYVSMIGTTSTAKNTIISSVNNEDKGTYVINEDKTITYTPPADYDGFDKLIIEVTINGISYIVNVNIDNTPEIDIPRELEFVIQNNETLDVDILAASTFSITTDVSVISAIPSGTGTVIINADNTITYTPETGFVGDETITFIIEVVHMDNSVTTETGSIDIEVIEVIE